MKFFTLLFLLSLSNFFCIAQDIEIEYPFGETGEPVPRGVFGEDDRKEVTDAEGIEDFVRATAVMIPKWRIDGNRVYGTSLRERLISQFGDFRFDKGVKFLDQPTVAGCTGFLIAPDILITAGHCIKSMYKAEDYVWVFDYTNELDFYDNTNSLYINPSNIYETTDVLAAYYEEPSPFDYSVLKLDRKSTRDPYRFRTSGGVLNGRNVYTIGSPTGLPLKFADNAQVTDDSPDHWFKNNIDTFPGNSGGPVFDPYGFIEGIIVRTSTKKVESGDYSASYGYYSDCNCIKTIQWDANVKYVGSQSFKITSVPYDLVHRALYENLEYAIQNNLEDRLDKWIIYSWIIDHEYTINRGALQFVAAKANNLNALQTIMEQSEKEVYDKNGRNLLFYAIENDNVEMVNFLLDQGVLINIGDNNKITPLHYAVINDKYDLTLLLLENGGEIDKISGSGNNLLHYAAFNGNFAMAEKLMELGLSPKIKNYNGRYPDKIARKNKHKSLSRYLKKARKRK
ncbi:ankyrin repeat domain-containing protein [Sabulilitoribacter multivorans]|uniref:Serine protease n=1 Tax=Flaviramulus multivorans TaxID=1304750 RepID=A0ABS9IMU5_9FLAO|nr:ankyrin repeat domain-containing protein [Flaviramulus multivorans]MCF7561882.1 ankyrin repeat domain-containing protein [Flaviramulus multivorans]